MPGNPQPGWQHQPADPYGHEDRSGRGYGGDPYRGGAYGSGAPGGTYGSGANGGTYGSGGTAYGPRGGYGNDEYGDQQAGASRPGAQGAAAPRPNAQRAAAARPGGPRSGGPRGRGRDRRPDRGLPDPADAQDARAPKRRRTPLWTKLMVAVGAVLMMLSGTALAGYEVLNNRYAGNVQQENLLGGAAVEPGQSLEGPINLVLLGVDARTPDTEDDVRSDTVIVLHVPSTHDQAYLMSVPRDTWVTVPGYWDMKITEAFYHGYQDIGGWEGGTQLVAQTLSNLTGLSFNGAAIINFSGFEKVIDEMGGIEYCVTDPTVSEHYVYVNGERMGVGKARREGHWPQDPVVYDEGCQQMEGWQALDYVRQRKNLQSGEGDYGRQRNQQLLLEAMARQATSPDVRTNLGTLDALLLAAGDAMIIDTNNVDPVDFLFTMRDIRPNDLISLQTNRGEFNSDQVNGQSIERLSEESLEMFRAAANDTMGEFVVRHPEFLNEEGAEILDDAGAETPPPG